MKFSVLIPVYNTSAYLDECMNSVLNQTYKNFEVILVDDGSTDNSPAICDRYQELYPDIVKVIHKENQGQLAARCDAIKMAAGDYCIFVDSDDLIIDSTLLQLTKVINEYCFPDLITYPFFYRTDDIDKESKLICSETTYWDASQICNFKHKFFDSVLLNSMCTKCTKTVILKNNINNIEPFISMRCSEDRLHSMWVLDGINNALFLNMPLYIYRLVSGSTTRSYTVESIGKFNSIILYEEQLRFAMKWGLYSIEWHERYDASCIQSMLYVFDLFYTNVIKYKRDEVIDYQWVDFIPYADVERALANSLINKTSRKLLTLVLHKDKKRIKCFYAKKRIYRFLRKMKRSIIG